MLEFVECTYCGVPANSLDHIIPVSYNYVSRKRAKYSKELCVPCCTECNNSLSNQWLPTISERAGYLLEKYNSKYNKILLQPDWEDWEIEELNGNIKIMVSSNMKKKKDILQRLTFMLNVFNENKLTIDDIWLKYPEGTYNKFK